MARLLVSLIDGGVFQPGDVVSVHPDDERLGMYEDIAEWVASGRPAETFPGAFAVLSVADATEDFGGLLDEAEEGGRLHYIPDAYAAIGGYSGSMAWAVLAGLISARG